MKLTICRLKAAERRKRLKMGIDSGLDDALKDFGDEVKIRDGTVTREVIRWKIVFFKERRDRSSFKRVRKIAFRESKINDICDWEGKGIKTRFEEKSGKNVKRARGIRR